MTLYSCRTPGNNSFAGTAGWVPDGASRAQDSCATQPFGALVADASLSPSRVGWIFTAAPNTAIRSFEAQVCMTTGPFGFTFFQQGTAAALSELPLPAGCGERDVVRGGGDQITRAAFYALCLGSCGANARLRTFRALISDPSRPVVSNVSGSLVSSVTQNGAESVTFDATDVGVGVYRAVALVRDAPEARWTEVRTTPIPDPRPCAPLHETANEYEFASPQPCPLAARGIGLTIEPGALPVGEHQLTVVVRDAAGNETTVLEPRTYTVPAPPLTTFTASAPPVEEPVVSEMSAPLASAPLADGLARLSITSPRTGPLPTAGAYRLSGRLLEQSGAPIAHARVQLATRGFLPKPRSSVGPWVPLGEAETSATGEFSARIPPGPSRSVLVSYRGATAQADLGVAAQIAVSARSRRVRNGHSAVLRGRVLGPIPSGGVPVGLEVRDGRRWIPVATTRRWVKTSRSGRFSLAYRFRRTFRPSVYRFRVVADEDSAFQYTRGASRAVDIRVRP